MKKIKRGYPQPGYILESTGAQVPASATTWRVRIDRASRVAQIERSTAGETRLEARDPIYAEVLALDDAVACVRDYKCGNDNNYPSRVVARRRPTRA